MKPSQAKPEVSVVMGVYNSASSLPQTLESVLSQEGVDFEFIVVNDGSTDLTGAILDQYAEQDARLRVFHQPNAGLTAALVMGCSEARGRWIARHDAGGDLSLSGRLKMQSKILRDSSSLVFISTGTRFVGPDSEFLFNDIISTEGLTKGLNTLAIPGIKGPCHGSVMFRASAYRRVGGYRTAFFVAQDIDLWLRMVEIGRCETIPEILYESRQTLGTISHRLRARQFEYGAVAIEGARHRRAGLPEPPLPEPIRPLNLSVTKPSRHERASFHYFLASCLRGHDPAGARRHYQLALRAQPFHLKALWRLLASGR